ncbi:MAG: hypothetical protein Q8R10_19855 [Pseudomonas sp.]|uniref:hypothetical protein n=1 Tax=Pseudomonas sp. TaxID=306 RepID=UPI0027358E38|nr:hypothetical protein [Pseudomonas sp.]MDP3848679.1 hypothetical protein [Pseudomonas sp.]
MYRSGDNDLTQQVLKDFERNAEGGQHVVAFPNLRLDRRSAKPLPLVTTFYVSAQGVVHCPFAPLPVPRAGFTPSRVGKRGQ